MSTIMLKEGVSPVLSLDEETFLEQYEEDGNFWGLPLEAFNIEMGSVYLLPEYAVKYVWSIDDEIDTEDDGVIDRLNIAVAFDYDRVVNPGSFCSFVDVVDVDGWCYK